MAYRETALRPLRLQQLTGQVHQAIQQAMLEQKLSPGQQLDVRKLAAQLGVSQTPVRYALTLLAKDGLVEVRPRSGTFVARFAAEDLAEVMDIRRALEMLACETAVVRVKDSHISRLKRLAQKIKSSGDAATEGRMAAKYHDWYNVAFHKLLMELSGNKRLLQLHRDLKIYELMARVHGHVPLEKSRFEQEAQQHDEIVAALEARDLARLLKAVDRHIKFSKTVLVNSMHLRTRGATGDLSFPESALEGGTS